MGKWRWFQRFLPVIVILIIIFPLTVSLYSQNQGIAEKSNPLNLIPYDAKFIGFVKNSFTNLLFFRYENLSGVVMIVKAFNISYVSPPLINYSSSGKLTIDTYFQNIPIFKAKLNESHYSGGIKKIIYDYFQTSSNITYFASPDPGTFVLGSLPSIICSLNSQTKGIGNPLIDYLNFSDQISFVYTNLSSKIIHISGNSTDGIMSVCIVTSSIRNAVYLSALLQYSLGPAFLVLPELDTVFVLTSLKNGFIFLQYNVLISFLKLEGLTF
ncbi:hypothetical protein [Caldiplasma sukawensis]